MNIINPKTINPLGAAMAAAACLIAAAFGAAAAASDVGSVAEDTCNSPLCASMPRDPLAREVPRRGAGDDPPPVKPPCDEHWCDPVPDPTGAGPDSPGVPFGDAQSTGPATGIGMTPMIHDQPLFGDGYYEIAHDALAGRKFAITVQMGNDLGEFKDCVSFGKEGALILQATQGMELHWDIEMGGELAGRFQAVTTAGKGSLNGFDMALHGAARGRDFVDGNIVNDRGLTFAFSGREDASCDLGKLRFAFGGPYGTAPVSGVVYEPNARSVAGRRFAARMFGDVAGIECPTFSIHGVLTGVGDASLLWRRDVLDRLEGSFQAVVRTGNPDSGLALHGWLTPWGELRIAGLSSEHEGARRMLGSGREAHSCIVDLGG